MPKRFCLDCRKLFEIGRDRSSRCPRCQPRTTAERGYGRDYEIQRAWVLANATHCGICGEPFKRGERKTAEHVYPLRLRKSRQGHVGKLVAAHERCNYGWNKSGRKV